MKPSVIGLCVWAALTFTACDLFDDSPCGPKKVFDLYLLGSSIVDTTTGFYYSYMNGSDRVFQWSQLVENVCPEEHVKVDCRVALLDETTTGINARGSVSWLFLFEENIPMTKNGSDLKGKGEAGLKQAFDTEPGWCVPTLEIYFPSKGSYAADTAFLKQNVISVELTANYRELK
ncbi:MAG: hypothetical protein IPL63_14980 [Saprospiraceae bacterium]|nr:hypothetical protein [Saprospiraceae bacterium]MBK8079786.1 hypothetical protein [Saprospiraceae bacterium]MBK8371336.1 hypothetical protein [Saprospiraceae bacterium]MBK8548599.1 hypothetical protein [Saprospiraceae bacterium]MBK8818706.1 hypothetical protein [Saprospiraceae bacterium]